MAPFIGRPDGSGPRATLVGPVVALGPTAVQALSMAFHELATNAAKFGALSVPEGQIAIDWELQDDTLHIAWHESGGPPSAAPAQRGFGTSLIQATITRQLGGKLQAEYTPEGLRWDVWLPFARLGAEATDTVAEGLPARA